MTINTIDELEINASLHRNGVPINVVMSNIKSKERMTSQLFDMTWLPTLILHAGATCPTASDEMWDGNRWMKLRGRGYSRCSPGEL